MDNLQEILESSDYPYVALIIVTHNSAHVVERISRNMLNTDYPQDKLSVFVIDNASNDDTPQIINSILKNSKLKYNFKVISLSKNLGFAGACNIALYRLKVDKVPYDYIVLMNPDVTIIDNQWLKKLVNISRILRNRFIISSVAFRDYEVLEPLVIYIDTFGFHIPLGEDHRKILLNKLNKILNSYNSRLRVVLSPIIRFSLVLIPRNIIDNIGFLDAKYFMYVEDTEYCLRAWSNGFGCIVYLQPLFVHTRGGSSTIYEEREKKIILKVFSMRNHLLTICKFFNPLICILQLFLHFTLGNFIMNRAANYTSVIVRNMHQLIKNVLNRKRLPKGLIASVLDLRKTRLFWTLKCIINCKYLQYSLVTCFEICFKNSARYVEHAYLLHFLRSLNIKSVKVNTNACSSDNLDF